VPSFLIPVESVEPVSAKSRAGVTMPRRAEVDRPIIRRQSVPGCPRVPVMQSDSLARDV
jgi:hypothetical protein